jgi:hypothetical protein
MHIKRYLVAGAVAATMAGGAFAFAANLDINTQTLASGSEPVVGGCDNLAVNWTSTSYDSANDVYELGTITVTGDANCSDETYKLVVTSGSSHVEYPSEQLTAGSDTVDASGDDIDANLVDGVTAVVTGDTATP